MTVQENGWQEVSSPFPPPGSLPVLATLTASLSHLVFSFQIIHFIRIMQGKYTHLNWRGIVRSDYPLLLSMAFTHCRQRKKKQLGPRHTYSACPANGKETPDKLWTVALVFLPFGLLLEKYELLWFLKEKQVVERRLAALEIYQKHLAREEEHFYH